MKIGGGGVGVGYETESGPIFIQLFPIHLIYITYNEQHSSEEAISNNMGI